MARTFDLCSTEDLRPGTMRAFDAGGREILLLRAADGSFFAMSNSCAHMGARLSEGRLQSKMDGPEQNGYSVSATEEIIRCPWHGYEFDIRSGVCAGDPENVRVRTYAVSAQDGRVLLQR